MTIGHRHGGDRGIDIINARFDTLSDGGSTQASGRMRMQLNWNVDGFLKLGNQFITDIGF